MQGPRLEHIPLGTLTANGNSAAFENLGLSEDQTVVLHLLIAGPVTGTTPSLVVSIDESVDGVNWALAAGSFPAQTVATPANTVIRLVVPNLFGPKYRISWAITGTTPSFGAVSVDVLFSSPDN